MKTFRCTVLTLLGVLILISGCVMPVKNSRPWLLEENATEEAESTLPAALRGIVPTARPAGAAYFTPTPDAPHTLPALRSDGFYYTVQSGDYLTLIAEQFNLAVTSLVSSNPDINPDTLEVGQTLFIPAPQASQEASDFKIIPDSELVYGPASATLDIEAFINQYGGYLSTYREEVDEEVLSGAQIVQRICYEYSVNPRLLLALLQYRSGWLTQTEPDSTLATYPMGRFETSRAGLYRQLAWAADRLNYAFYLYQNNGLSYVILSDGNLVLLSTIINPGTAAVQYLLAQMTDLSGYRQAISESGLYAVYFNLYGIPFDLAVEPLLPASLSQPALQLPFENGVPWYFTGGPHGGWGDGSAWAAIDFGPRGDTYGCFTSDEWVLAAADGLITRAKDGGVVLDLDGDGMEQTGWTLLYMHIETRDRVSPGTYVKAGDRIGHPSCEGGVSNGTHVHIARRYNGEWIAADGSLPFNLEGWISSGSGSEYDGTLTRNGLTVTAEDGRIAENEIQR